MIHDKLSSKPQVFIKALRGEAEMVQLLGDPIHESNRFTLMIYH